MFFLFLAPGSLALIISHTCVKKDIVVLCLFVKMPQGLPLWWQIKTASKFTVFSGSDRVAVAAHNGRQLGLGE